MEHELKEELTTKMHSEFTVSAETEIKHRAGCVWGMLYREKMTNDKTQLSYECKLYGISVEQAMKYKAFWMSKYK